MRQLTFLIFFLQDYIIAVCSSCSSALSLEEAVLNENNNTSQFDRTSTTNTSSPQFLQQVPTVEGLLRDPSSEIITRLKDQKDVTLNRQECAYTANEKSVPFAEQIEDQQVDGMVVKDEKKLSEEPKIYKPEVTTREKKEKCDESRRDFALKLGYSESSISNGLSKLGPSADQNSLLSELVKAESSVKQLEEGSSTFSGHDKPHPVPEDWTCLRPIVIDGSNVAMR